MQSELNAIGERAGLIHLRGLDVDVAIPDSERARTATDVIVIGIAAVTVLVATAARIVT